ncbi:MAG: hypothetical protein L0H41_10305 [Microlunatus sp.]|nr:hypothetical protein [Microlunatus sp.]MDN5803337.1 hypothetical protein [Microlunatus sp.]
MFETGVRQFRMAMSMVWGRPFDPEGLTKLVRDATRTVAEFGELGDQAREVIDSPFASESDRRDHADRSLRRTARRLALLSPFYAERFAAAGFTARTADTDSLLALPVTTKQDLLARSAELICHGSRPQLATRTTGTTGRALEIWLSSYEVQVAAALGALSGSCTMSCAPTTSCRSTSAPGRRRPSS